MNNQLNVVFTIDEKFIQHFSVTLISLLKNNQDIAFNIYVIHDITETGQLDRVIEFAKNKYNTVFYLVTIDASVFDSFKINRHYSKAVYFRLLFTEILPKDLDKILFLDSDIVVTGSLKELAEYKFDKLQLLAVNDMDQEEHIEQLGEMGFPIKRYFNAGVLLINLKGWRELSAAWGLIDLANKNMDKISWWDQDLLNMYFYDKWDNMDDKYNALHLSKEKPELPIIVHYAGPHKPWLFMYGPPYKWLYWEYIKLTPFKKIGFPDLTLRNVLIKIDRKIRSIIFDYLIPPKKTKV